MPNTRAMRAANAAPDADCQPSDDSYYDEVTEQSPKRAPEPVQAPERAGANARMDTETFLANMMESFVKMQAETNRCLVETLRSLPNNSGPWQSPLPTSTPTPSPAAVSTGGNFAKCTARFNGFTHEPEVLEAFIDAVQIYKEREYFSDPPDLWRKCSEFS
ncbi:hypothetical protein HF086_000222 [Spodoptera exigua]|uniref:Uncharacterized protein n=1 Tax=Spodoptera exigua TaxID=7107 RepID=A0A922SE56_SPOEX|nr:hypothetical protein HF086_000222 [Spodoptera exigua]